MQKNGLTMQDKLDIANSGGQFPETDEYSWVGKQIRKGTKMGKVIGDSNGASRILTVKFEDGAEEEIRMSNIGPDPEEVHQYEWLCKNFHGANGVEEKWLRF